MEVLGHAEDLFGMLRMRWTCVSVNVCGVRLHDGVAYWHSNTPSAIGRSDLVASSCAFRKIGRRQ